MNDITTIHDAAEHGDLESVRNLLDENPSLVNAELSDDFPDTSLHLAAWQGHVSVVRKMLRNDAQAVSRAPLPTHLLHDAATMINGKLYEFDVAGSDADLQNVDEVVNRELDVIRALVRQDPPIDPMMHYTAMFVAVGLPHTGVAEILLEYHSTVQRPSQNEMSKLSYVAGFSRRSSEMRELLKRNGVD